MRRRVLDVHRSASRRHNENAKQWQEQTKQLTRFMRALKRSAASMTRRTDARCKRSASICRVMNADLRASAIAYAGTPAYAPAAPPIALHTHTRALLT